VAWLHFVLSEKEPQILIKMIWWQSLL